MLDNSYVIPNLSKNNIDIDYKPYENIGTWYFDVECDWDGWKYYFPQYFGGACLGRMAFCPYISKNFLYVEDALYPLLKRQKLSDDHQNTIDDLSDLLGKR